MFKSISNIFILVLLFASCQESVQKEYDSSLINREELDMALGNGVSKVLFDHLYVVVDSITYERLTNDSLWKNKYAALDAGLPDFDSIVSGSSCYLRGHQHSIEILGPRNTYNEPVGKSGLGFSLKNKGEHFHLGVKPKPRTVKDSLLHGNEIVEMPLDGENHTWFKAFFTPSRGTALHTWYAFYNHDFLNQLNNTAHTQYSRAAFLEDSYASDKLFNSINEIQLSCTQKDFRRIAQELGYLQCELLAQNGTEYTIKSGDINLVIKPSNDIPYSRITQIICNLNQADESVSRLGNITITNQGKESIWNFDELHNSITN